MRLAIVVQTLSPLEWRDELECRLELLESVLADHEESERAIEETKRLHTASSRQRFLR